MGEAGASSEDSGAGIREGKAVRGPGLVEAVSLHQVKTHTP